jgi:hypothetical protein
MYERSRFAVCISIGKTAGGELRLLVDDVECNGLDPLQWRHFTFVTDAAVAATDLAQMRFTDEQLANFGRLVLGAVAVHVPPS